MRKHTFYVLTLSDALIWDQGTYGLNDMGKIVMPLIALGFLPCSVSVRAALRWCIEMAFVT